MPPRRPRHNLPVIFTTLTAFSLFLAAPTLLPRPILGLGDTNHLPFHLAIDADHTTLSWYPAHGVRAPWAGQVERFGVRYSVYTYDGSYVSVPTFYLVLLTATAALAAHFLARRRPRPGLCPQCGYDIRATPHRCPECGATP